MKKIIGLIVILAASACTDLDVFPSNSDLAPGVFTNAEAYKAYMAKIYAAYSHTGQQGPNGKPDITLVSDEGFTSYIRAYWKAQELTTDEAVIAWTDAGIRDMHTHNWNSDNQFVRVVYYRIFLIIAFANDFLDQSKPATMSTYGVSASDQAIVAEYRAEVRFLRAMAYWHALDLFRNVPLLTSATSELPTQATPLELYTFIIDELNAIEADMSPARTNEYGRADVAALWMLRAKVNLNAEVYIGTSKYNEVISDTENVISAGYALNSVYANNFKADNHLSPEMIFTLPADGLRAQNWGNTTFLVHGSIGGTMVDTDYGVLGPWAGLRTTSAMVDKFFDNGVQVDPRGIFYTDGQTLDIPDIGTFSGGYAVPKYTNKTSTGGNGSDETFVDTDYPMFRLGDAYLMHAEALLRGGSGGALTISDAVNHVNLLRERAYGDASGNILQGDLTLDFLLDERSRELYWEATRRVDLIRFGKFNDGVWPWKGGIADGNFVTPATFNIFPIPASDLVANPKLVQNDGY